MKDIAKAIYDRVTADQKAPRYDAHPSELPDVYLVDGKHIRNLARVYNTIVYLCSKGDTAHESELDAFMEVALDILEATGVDRGMLGNLEVLE